MTREDAARLREYKSWFYDAHGHVPTGREIAIFAALSGIVLDDPPAFGGIIIEFSRRDAEHVPAEHIGDEVFEASDDIEVGAEPLDEHRRRLED